FAASAYASTSTSAEALDFWQRYLASLPTHTLGSEMHVFPSTSRTLRWRMNDNEYVNIQALARHFNVLPQVVYFCLFEMLIFCLSQNTRFATRMPVAGRNAPGLDRLIGPFANMILVKTELQADTPLNELVHLTQRNMSQAKSYSEIPLTLMCKQINASPLEAFTEFGFAYYQDLSESDRAKTESPDEAGARIAPHPSLPAINQNCLALFETNQALFAQLTLSDTLYNKPFDEGLIRQILHYFSESLHFSCSETLALCAQKPRLWLGL
ncbi:MAG TPA: condensation domain-containing protein, partial [Pseudomonadales bacterium]|nr:condensation domain-containing protein [Pseudomonadales bacterium]